MSENDTEQMIATPATFGHFMLERELGHGGMGGVYLARDKMLDRKVGIKVMLKSLGDDPAFVERFQREAQAAARLNHPNIAQIYSFGTEQGMPYIAMEFVGGGSLDKEMEANPGTMDPLHVMKIGQQMADALAAAAENGLVHGDVKPENVLFDNDGNAKLVDFGLAAMQGDSSEIWGTPYYISPEKVRRQKIDFRADIYSLGGTLYHALTGVAPFEGEDATAVVKARFDGPPKPPSEVRPDLPKELDAIIMRMLELEPAMRYPTYKSLAGDISRFIAKAGQSKSARLASGKFKIKGAKIRIKPTGAPRVVGEQEGEEQQPYVKPLVEEKPERRTNLGKMVAFTVLGVVLAIVGTVGGLLWYVKANAEKKQRAEQAGYAKDAADARNAIANTVARTDEFAANFHDMVVRNDRLMADAVRKMRAELPAEYKVAAGAILEPVPSKEIADAIAYTNKLLSAKQGQTAAAPDAAKKPDDAKKDDAKKADGDKAKADAEKKGGDKAKDAKAGKKPAAQDSAIDDDEADKIEKPEEDVKAAVAANPEVAAKIAAAKATAIAMAKASGAEVSAVEVKTIAVKLPAAVVKFGDLWADVFVCRAADIRVQGHVKRIKAMAAAADEIKASDAAAAEALARISQEVLEEHERMKGLKHVELAQRKAGVVRNNSQSYVKTAVIQLANAKAKKEKEARDAAERKAREEKEQAEKELREKLKAEEPKAAADKFDSLAQTLLKTLEWDKAIRQLKAMAEVFKTPEGREEARSQMTKVECMKGLQEHFVKFAKNFKFKDGSIVKAVDGKGLTIQKLKSVRGRMEPDKVVKVEWERFYGKLEYVGYMDQLINALVIKGRDTTKIGPLLWSRHMLGAALTLKHLYGEVPGAEQKAPILVKTAVKEFSDSAKWAKKWFPDVETETNEQ